MIAMALEIGGYAVTPVRDSATAVRTVRSSPPVEGATLDLRMPGMGETLAQVKSTAPRLPVIIVSGYAESADVEACLGLGAFTVVRKPFELDELLELLRRARGNRTCTPRFDRRLELRRGANPSELDVRRLG
jgi:CheY-like chemotaxis protein